MANMSFVSPKQLEILLSEPNLAKGETKNHLASCEIKLQEAKNRDWSKKSAIHSIVPLS